MPHILKNPEKYIGHGLVGEGNCVDLIKGTIDDLKERSTATWKPGELVLASKDLKKGTAIATFLCGRYPQDGVTGKHAAIFLRYWGKPNPDGTYNSILVLDQWKSRGNAMTRELRKTGRTGMACSGGIYDASNTLDAFYVIE
jgi:hypothetical protein